MESIKNFYKQRSFVIGVVICGAIIFFAGYTLGRSYVSPESKIDDLINKNQIASSTVDFAPFWKAWEVINEKYVPTNSTTTVRVDDQTRVWGAIEGATKALGDPYTMFFPPVENKSFNEQINGAFEGVGIELGQRDGILTVISPLKGTPAYRAGIKPGDKIIQIDKTITNKMTVDESIALIKGPKGTTVTFTIVREGLKDPIIIPVVRDVIDIPTIDTELKDDVFVIHLYNFSATSANLFRESLRKFVESGKYKLVLDLRGNPGGYLEAAIDMASWFLPAGKVVVSEDFRNHTDNQVYRSKGYNIFNDKLKMIILIDGGSASASEILAGALHEQGVATLVGMQSFGKGSVQELVPITDETSLKVTIAKWLTPNGTSISHGGLTPDVVVKMDDKEFLKGIDTQMNKALEILKNQ